MNTEDNSTLHMIFDTPDETASLGMENMPYIGRNERRIWVTHEIRKTMLEVDLVVYSAQSEEIKFDMTNQMVGRLLKEQLFCGVHDSEEWKEFSEEESRDAAAQSMALLTEEETEDANSCVMSSFLSIMNRLGEVLGDPSEMDGVGQRAFFDTVLTGAANEVYVMGLRYGPAMRDLKALEAIGVQDA